MDSLSVSMMKGFAVWIEGTSVTGFRLNLGSLRPLGVAPVGICPAPALGPLAKAGSTEMVAGRRARHTTFKILKERDKGCTYASD